MVHTFFSASDNNAHSPLFWRISRQGGLAMQDERMGFPGLQDMGTYHGGHCMGHDYACMHCIFRRGMRHGIMVMIRKRARDDS